MEALISIVMPVYNCENFVQDSIRSICEQTYSNWELIIVDDCSTDSTVDKISQIEDERIHVIKIEEHLGLTAAFAEGYKHAEGDYIMRQDGDDISLPDRLEIQVSYLEANPEKGMVSCLISCFTRDPIFRRDCVFIEKIQNYYRSNDQIRSAILGGFIPILFPTLMIRKKVFVKVFNEDKKMDFDDQYELLLDLFKVSEVEKVNSILYSYRRHKDAYHIQNLNSYEHYIASLINSSDFRNRIKYKEFYKNLKISSEERQMVNDDSQIRVLMMVDALNIGGTETHVLNVSKKLMEMGIYVVVATTGGPMEGIFQSYGIKIIKIPIQGDYISNKRKFGLLRTLKNIIDEERINIIHSHLFASMQLASELYRMYKIPYVITIHGLFYPNDVLYSTCIEASQTIAVSEPVRKMLDKKLGSRIQDKITVIPNGISADLIRRTENEMDISKELNLPKNAKILCYCSRLDWNKTDAARIFLFSFSQLVEQTPNLHAIIIGDGLGKESIEKEAEIINQMVNKKVVHVIGAKVDVVPYFQRSTIVIGTARVALEAMMCERPVIAIGNQGYVGIVNERNKENQWQMYFGDHEAIEKPNVSRLIKDIKYLMANSDRRRRIGEWGRSWCDKMFNNDKIVKEIIENYSKILNRQN